MHDGSLRNARMERRVPRWRPGCVAATTIPLPEKRAPRFRFVRMRPVPGAFRGVRGGPAMTRRPAMPVIPVIDLLGGVVVRAVRGERGRYGPVRSVLAPGHGPLAMAAALREATGCPAMYVADLDALLGRGDNRPLLRAMAHAASCELWVDAGAACAHSALELLEAGAGRVVAGTESLRSLEDLAAMGQALSPEKLLVSVDVLHGVLMSEAAGLRGVPPLEGLGLLAATGVRRFILLALDAVGTGNGPDWELLARARALLPDAVLVLGGGVRNMEDIRRAGALGLDGMLTATALHAGWITAQEMRDWQGQGQP